MDTPRLHHRKHYRKKLKNLPSVFLTTTANEFGLVVDINVDGMMVLTTAAHPINQRYQLSLPPLEPLPDCAPIELTVIVLWCEETGDNQQYWVGCQFVELTPATTNGIRQWVDNPFI